MRFPIARPAIRVCAALRLARSAACAALLACTAGFPRKRPFLFLARRLLCGICSRFMDLMVLPQIENEHERTRTQDELPQSSGGRTITTTEPKFITRT